MRLLLGPHAIHAAAIRFATLLIVAYACIFVSHFREFGNLQAICFAVAAIGIGAIGMGTVTLSGNLFMLSMGATASLSTVIFATTLRFGLPAALLATLSAGTALGCAQGLLVAAAGANPIITTIAASSIISGIGVLWTGGQTIFGIGDASWLASGHLLGPVPNQIVVLMIFSAVIAFVFAKTRIGREVRLMGMQADVARMAGLRLIRATLLPYTLAGLSSALAGCLIASAASQGNMTYGFDLDFNAIAAVLVGGISIRGGRGTVLDAVMGAIFLGVIGNILLVSGARYESQLLVKGAVVLGSVILGTLALRLAPRKAIS